jgi:hypothetical protein
MPRFQVDMHWASHGNPTSLCHKLSSQEHVIRFWPRRFKGLFLVYSEEICSYSFKISVDTTLILSFLQTLSHEEVS